MLLSYVLCKYFEECPVETDELWRASADTEFISFVIDIIAGPDFLDHYVVSRSALVSTCLWSYTPLYISHIQKFSSNMCGTLMELLKTWLLDVDSGQATRIMHPELSDTIWDYTESIWINLWDRRSSLAHRCELDIAWRGVAIALDLIAHALRALRARYSTFHSPLPASTRSY